MSWYHDAPPPADFGNGYARAEPSWSVGAPQYAYADPVGVDADAGKRPPADQVSSPEDGVPLAGSAAVADAPVPAFLSDPPASTAPYDTPAPRYSYDTPGPTSAHDTPAPRAAPADDLAVTGYDAPAPDPDAGVWAATPPEPPANGNGQGSGTPPVSTTYAVPAEVLGAFQYGGSVEDPVRTPEGATLAVPASSRSTVRPPSPYAAPLDSTVESPPPGVASYPPGGDAFTVVAPPPRRPTAGDSNNKRVLLLVGLAVVSLLLGSVAFAATRGGRSENVATAPENTTITTKARVPTTKDAAAADAGTAVASSPDSTDTTDPTGAAPPIDITETPAPPLTTVTTISSFPTTPAPTFRPTTTIVRTTLPPRFDPGSNPTPTPTPTPTPAPTAAPNPPPNVTMSASANGTTIVAAIAIQSPTSTVCDLFIDGTNRASGSCSSLSAGGFAYYSAHGVVVRATNAGGSTDTGSARSVGIGAPPTLSVTVGGGKNGYNPPAPAKWAYRTSPSVDASSIIPGTPLNLGQRVTIICQRIGPAFHGSSVWDYVNNHWVTDLFTNDTPPTSPDGRVTTTCPPGV